MRRGWTRHPDPAREAGFSSGNGTELDILGRRYLPPTCHVGSAYGSVNSP